MQTPTLSDTDPAVERLQLQLIRSAPSWRRAEMAGQMFETMKQLALSGLRQRNPQTSETELRRRLADLLLGPGAGQAGLRTARQNRSCIMLTEPIAVTFGSFNLIHLKTMFKVDVFVRSRQPFDQTQFRRRQVNVLAQDPNAWPTLRVLRTTSWPNSCGIARAVRSPIANGKILSM